MEEDERRRMAFLERRNPDFGQIGDELERRLKVPQPDRSDGDDLPSGTILQIGGGGSGMGWGCNTIEVRESTGGGGWRWRAITAVENQWLIDALNAHVSPPTRDDAEGAGNLFERVRNYLDSVCPCKTFLAGPSGQCSYCDHELACHPSPAVAAEPVAPTRDDFYKFLDKHTSLPEVTNLYLCRIAAEQYGWFSATPPVRGDREAIARTIFKSRLKVGDQTANVYFARHASHPHAIDDSTMAVDAAFRDADAILSIPVQSTIAKDKFYAALSGHLANDMIDIVWQAVQESGALAGVQSGAGKRGELKNAFYEGFELGRSNQSPDDYWPHSEAKAAGQEL